MSTEICLEIRNNGFNYKKKFHRTPRSITTTHYSNKWECIDLVMKSFNVDYVVF